MDAVLMESSYKSLCALYINISGFLCAKSHIVLKRTTLEKVVCQYISEDIYIYKIRLKYIYADGDREKIFIKEVRFFFKFILFTLIIFIKLHRGMYLTFVMTCDVIER